MRSREVSCGLVGNPLSSRVAKWQKVRIRLWREGGGGGGGGVCAGVATIIWGLHTPGCTKVLVKFTKLSKVDSHAEVELMPVDEQRLRLIPAVPFDSHGIARVRARMDSIGNSALSSAWGS